MYKCKVCDNVDVSVDAMIEWQTELTEWQIVEIFPTGLCTECGYTGILIVMEDIKDGEHI